MTINVEVCVGDVTGVLIADAAGAQRVELCDSLLVGGTTPSIGTFLAALDGVQQIGIHTLIRPREGDFVFSAPEIATMVADIAAMRQLGRSARTEVGFVIGALNTAGEIDVAICRELIAAADGAPVSFHRAFDLTADLATSLDTLIELGIVRVLTGGGAGRASSGLKQLAALVTQGGDRIAIMAGGGVRPHNVADIIAATNVRDVHFKATGHLDNRPTPRNIPMTVGRAPSDKQRDVTSRAAVDDMMGVIAPR